MHSGIVTGERAGQLLANFLPVPGVFAKVNVASSPLLSKVANVAES